MQLEKMCANNFMYKLPKKILIFLLFSLFLFGCKSSYKSEDVVSSIKKENAEFGILITAFREKRNFAQVLGGVNYFFEVKTKEEPDWKEIMVVHHDDGLQFDENNIILVNSEIGFVFLSDKYAITLNSGKNWTSSQIEDNDPSCKIETVRLQKGGKGSMLLNCNNGSKKLFTRNYGVEWKSKI